MSYIELSEEQELVFAEVSISGFDYYDLYRYLTSYEKGWTGRIGKAKGLRSELKYIGIALNKRSSLPKHSISILGDVAWIGFNVMPLPEVNIHVVLNK